MRSTTSPRGNYGVELFLEADGRDAGEEGPVARRVARLSRAVPGDETPSRGVGRALRRAMPPNFGEVNALEYNRMRDAEHHGNIVRFPASTEANRSCETNGK